MTGLSTDPGELQVGAREMAAGRPPGSGPPGAIHRAFRAVATGAGNGPASESATRMAQLWGAELADLDERIGRFATGLQSAGETYAAGEASVVASVRRR